MDSGAGPGLGIPWRGLGRYQGSNGVWAMREGGLQIINPEAWKERGSLV